MALFLAITGFVLLVMETIVGVVANGSIVLVCCIDLFRSRKLPPTDLILICLASSRLLWQAVIILHVTMLSFFLHMYVLKEFHLITVIVWFFAETLGLWFATCLSVWYLIKIAVFSHPIFLQVKQRLSGMVPELLLGSVVVSVFVTIIKAVIIFTGSLGSSALCDPYKALLNNSRDPGLKKPRSCMDLAISCIVPNAIPAVIFLSSTILLILSLWKHTRHLQHSGIGVRDLNTNAHLSAIKAMASFAVLCLVCFHREMINKKVEDKNITEGMTFGTIAEMTRSIRE
ncbi:taste receptor type 2 member 2-like [Paroedura picta]|uniref:taste receptor type 2 member 2-like n=1 Tax=Paroedura picta TaxID=143630 RepID=UPI004057B7EA